MTSIYGSQLLTYNNIIVYMSRYMYNERCPVSLREHQLIYIHKVDGTPGGCRANIVVMLVCAELLA